MTRLRAAYHATADTLTVAGLLIVAAPSILRAAWGAARQATSEPDRDDVLERFDFELWGIEMGAEA